MKFCPNCGQGNDDNASFCTMCGKDLRVKPQWETTPGQAPSEAGVPPPPPYSDSSVLPGVTHDIIPPPTGFGPLGRTQPPIYPHTPYQYSKTDSYAIASLIAGIVSFFICGFVGGILAIIFGKIAQRNITESGGALTGEQYATIGIVLGWINVVLYLVFIMTWIIIVAVNH